MTDIPNGYYTDPLDPSVERLWSRGHWAISVRSGSEEPDYSRPASHVMKSLPRPGDTSIVVVNATDPTPSHSQAAAPTHSNAPLVVAILWTVVAVIVGLVFIFGTEDQHYGGDAYSGIQQAGAQTVRAIGWLIIATGPIGLIIALSRR